MNFEPKILKRGGATLSSLRNNRARNFLQYKLAPRSVEKFRESWEMRDFLAEFRLKVGNAALISPLGL